MMRAAAKKERGWPLSPRSAISPAHEYTHQIEIELTAASSQRPERRHRRHSRGDGGSTALARSRHVAVIAQKVRQPVCRRAAVASFVLGSHLLDDLDNLGRA